MAPVCAGTVLYVLGSCPVPSETFIRREISALRAAGLRVEIFRLRRGRGEDDGTAADAVQAPLGGLLANPLPAWRLAREGWRVTRRWRDRSYALAAAARVAWAARYFRGRGITRVHAHFATVPGLAGMWLARELGVPFSFTAHAYDLFTARSLFNVLAPAAEFLVVPAEYHQQWIREHHGSAAAEKTRVVRCGIPDHWLRYRVGDYGRNTGMLGAGRLVPKKGFDLLLRALRQMPAAEWRIIGAGPQFRKLWRLAEFDRLRPARFTRWSDEKRLRLEQAASICVFPCRVLPDGDRDGLPVTLLEAMALGAPVVATPVAGIPEAISHNVNGLLVPENDADALAAALRRLQSDRELRARLGAAARATMRQDFLQSQSTRALLELFGMPRAAAPPAAARPRRVLRVINNLECGGAQRLLLQWVKNHDRARYATVVAVFAGGSLADEFAAAGVPVHIVPRRGKYDISLIGRLAQIIRENKIELVHAQLFAAKMWARLAARRAGVPCAVSEYAIHPRTRRGLYRWSERCLAPHTAGWSVDYPGLADYLVAAHGAVRGRIITTGPGVEPGRLRARRSRAEVRAALGIADAAVVALGLGRLTEQKGFLPLLAAYARVAVAARGAVTGPVHIVIAGDGPQRAALATVARLPALAGIVHCVGEQRNIGDWLAAADVLVLPSQWEGLPLAVLEAAAAGLPVVACDLPGLQQLAGAWEGLTLVQDAGAMAAVLLGLAQCAVTEGKLPARVPWRVTTAADYVRNLADWYDGIAAARA